MIDKDGQRYTSVDSNRSLSSTIEKHYIFSNKNLVVEKWYLNNTKNGLNAKHPWINICS